VLEDDDEVAVLHGPEELGYPPLTEAMVNIRATLAEAVRGGILESALAEPLTGIAKKLFYKHRTYEAVLETAAASALPADPLRALAEWLPAGRIDQKRLDAEAMITAILAHVAADAPPLRVTYTLAETAAWEAVRQHIRKHLTEES
jgi:hypothetical protein